MSTANWERLSGLVGVDIDRDDNENIKFGTGDDVVFQHDGTSLNILPATDDTGSIRVGNGTKDVDLKVFLGSTTEYVEFEVGASQMNIEGVPLHLGDNDLIEFGDATGGDATLGWDGSNSLLEILPTTDDTGVLSIGDGTTDMDVKIFLATTAQWALFDVGAARMELEGIDSVFNGTTASATMTADFSADQLDFNGIDIRLQDADEVRFGDATGGDVAIAWDGSWLAAQKTAHTIWNGAPSHADPSIITHEFFEDFYEYDTTDALWTVTEDDAADTQAVIDANFGVMVLTCKATTDNDGQQIQVAQETFQMISGKEIWYETKLRLNSGDATEVDLIFGLIEAEDLTAIADNMPANGFGFKKDDGDTNVDLFTSDGGSNVQQATVDTLVDTAFVRYGMHFDGGATGSGIITPYIDGVAGTAITTAAYATMAEVSPYFMVRNGDGTTKQILEIDYVKVIQER